MSEDSKKPKPAPSKGDAAKQDARLRSALRANLNKRKAQARARRSERDAD
jgi:hypothetical protein